MVWGRWGSQPGAGAFHIDVDWGLIRDCAQTILRVSVD